MISQGMAVWLRQVVRNVLEQSLGLMILRPQHGARETNDLLACGCCIEVIFDVGANIGQTACRFRRAFPKAMIYCFEPVQSTFEQLRANMDKDQYCDCRRLALGDSAGATSIFVTDLSTTCSLRRPDRYLREENVAVTTVDAFCTEHGIQRIDLLKIDAEGHDLQVLQGAMRMLAEGRVSFVLAEVGFTPGDERHVLFDDVRALLLPHGFRLFGIYGQQLEWTGEKQLRFANALFSRAQPFMP